MTRRLAILVTLSALVGCTAAQGQQALSTTSAVVKAARAVCRWVNLLPDLPAPAPPVPVDPPQASSGGERATDAGAP